MAKKRNIRTLFIFIILIVLFFGNPLYIVHEGDQVVVTRFGEIVSSTQNAGLYVKVPFVDSAYYYTKKLLSLDGDPQRIPTKENQFIIVDTTSRWRISDPVKFYESVRTTEGAYSKLADIVDSAVRTIITSSSLSDVVRSSNMINDSIHEEKFDLGTEIDVATIENNTEKKIVYEKISKGREALSIEMRNFAQEKLPSFGIELIDIVLCEIRYSDELTESVYNRMIKDRNQIAQRFRSTGEGRKAEWLGKLENEKKATLSGAYNTAEGIKGTADATAAQIYAQAYNKSPEFYAFWKSIEVYRKTLPEFEKVLSTDMEYFKYLYKP